MRVISWNVQRLKGGAGRVANACLACSADFIALQEYLPGPRAIEFDSVLKQGGYSHRLPPKLDAGAAGSIHNIVYSRTAIRAEPSPKLLPENTPYWIETSWREI
ncbi:MAG: endonuclease/exonuclease/phosphatase family protein, partial [Candidatus Sulfotelmatobacter sp.]